MRHSESIKEIGAALSKAQGQISGASKDRINTFFNNSKYADLASVWDACREALTANGIAVVQSPAAEGNKIKLTTLLVHTSGEWMEGDLEMTADKSTPQAFGSCITYARRYALSAFVGVAPSDDDDGNAASGNSANKGADNKRTNGKPKSGDPAPTPQRHEPTVREQTIDIARGAIKAMSSADHATSLAKKIKLSRAENKIDDDDVLFLMEELTAKVDSLQPAAV